MGVYVKGMKRPDSCIDCPLFESKYNFHGCHAKEESFNDKCMWDFYGSKPLWCPLVGLPPHGRLIDADALLYETRDCDICEGDKIMESIYDAPTVIDAEGELDFSGMSDGNDIDLDFSGLDSIEAEGTK